MSLSSLPSLPSLPSTPSTPSLNFSFSFSTPPLNSFASPLSSPSSLPSPPPSPSPSITTLYIPHDHLLPPRPGCPPVTWTMVDKRSYDPSSYFRVPAGELVELWHEGKYMYTALRMWGIYWGPVVGEAYEEPDLESDYVCFPKSQRLYCHNPNNLSLYRDGPGRCFIDPGLSFDVIFREWKGHVRSFKKFSVIPATAPEPPSEVEKDGMMTFIKRRIGDRRRSNTSTKSDRKRFREENQIESRRMSEEVWTEKEIKKWRQKTKDMISDPTLIATSNVACRENDFLL